MSFKWDNTHKGLDQCPTQAVSSSGVILIWDGGRSRERSTPRTRSLAQQGEWLSASVWDRPGFRPHLPLSLSCTQLHRLLWKINKQKMHVMCLLWLLQKKGLLRVGALVFNTIITFLEKSLKLIKMAPKGKTKRREEEELSEVPSPRSGPSFLSRVATCSPMGKVQLPSHKTPLIPWITLFTDAGQTAGIPAGAWWQSPHHAGVWTPGCKGLHLRLKGIQALSSPFPLFFFPPFYPLHIFKNIVIKILIGRVCSGRLAKLLMITSIK